MRDGLIFDCAWKGDRMIDRAERRLERAVILAAGTGSRLVASEVFPKPLKRVAGVPLLVRVLRTLQGEGIREAVIIVGYRGDHIRKALSRLRA